MSVTIKQLADVMGLDHSTVAYALSGKGTIRQDTRDRVFQKATELGYMPNRLARQLRTRQTRVIGLVIPDVVLAYNEIVQQTFRGIISRGYDIEIALTEFDADLENRAIRSLLESRVDGIILKTRYAHWSDVPTDSSLRQLVAQQIPTVCLDYAAEGSGLSCFQSPAKAIGRLITEHLLTQGRRQITWLFPQPEPLAMVHLQRVDGAKEALRAAGQDASTLRVLTPEQGDLPQIATPTGSPDPYRNYIDQCLPRTGIALGQLLFARAMAMNPRPTDVVCYNDVLAIGAMMEAQRMGLRVPNEVTISATTHTVASELAPLSLTTAYTPVHEMVRVTLDLLFDSIGSQRLPQPARNISIDPQLIVGASTFPAPASSTVHG